MSEEPDDYDFDQEAKACAKELFYRFDNVYVETVVKRYLLKAYRQATHELSWRPQTEK